MENKWEYLNVLWIAPVGAFVLWLAIAIVYGIPHSIASNYEWNKNVESYFTLSDKASTATKKIEYLNKYISAIESRGLTEGQSAMMFPSPNSDLATNYQVLKSLQQRLNDISKLNISSLEYQQAMSQLTTQEYKGFDSCVFLDGNILKGGFLNRIWTISGSCQDGQPPASNTSN